MVEIENIGNPHIPLGMKKEVSEEEADKLITTDNWKIVGVETTTKKEITKKKKKELINLKDEIHLIGEEKDKNIITEEI